MRISQIVEGIDESFLDRSPKILDELTQNYPEYVKQKTPQLYNTLRQKGPTAFAKAARTLQKAMNKVKEKEAGVKEATKTAAPTGTVKPLKPMKPIMKDPVVVNGIGTMERKQAEQHYKGFPLKK